MNNSIEDKYQILSDIDHILLRPGHQLGNMHTEIVGYNLFKPSENKIVNINVPYNAGLLKLVDEVLTNSIDERNNATRLFDVTEINVEAYSDGKIIIRDNGGIPIKIHQQTQVYLPQMIFGMLRTSSNYTDTREGAGLNGLGSKLANIFSTKFNVETCDGKLKFNGHWSNNMKEFTGDKVIPTKDHYTQTTFHIDLKRFEIEKLDISTVQIIQKRCIDAAASNIGLKVTFKTDLAGGKLDSSWEFESFTEFVKLHLNKPNETQILEFKSSNGKDDVCILPNIGYNFGFVNGAICSDGTHMKKVINQISEKLLDLLKVEKGIELITPTDIKNEMTIFCRTKLMNPDYDSQAKDKLTSKIASTTLNLNQEFLDKLKGSDIFNNLVDYYNVKYLKEQKAQLRKLNKELKVTKSKKLIKCTSTNTNLTELWLFEGTSASNGFKEARNPILQACYLLRGKVKNTFNLTKAEIVENQELKEIIATLGLQFNDPKGNIKNCRFGKIIIATDADNDGSHITGLLITFFAKNFPELIIDGRLYRALSPIIIASKGKEEKMYYSQDDFNKDEENLKGWDIAYKKGLGALENHHYLDFVANKRLEQFVLENGYMETIKVWFDKSTEQRKAILGEESNITQED